MRNVLHYQMCNFPLWVNQGPKPVYSRSLRWRVVQIRQKVIWPPALTFHLLDCIASIAGCSVSSVIKSIWWYLLFFIFWPHCMACGILVPLTMWSPNHWTTRKSLMVHFKLSTCCALKIFFLSTLSLYLSRGVFVPVYVKTVCKFGAGPLLYGGKFFFFPSYLVNFTC